MTQGQLAGLVAKEKITQADADRQLEEVVGRIRGTTSYEGFGDVDFVVEAVPERMQIKQAVFGELDACTPGHAILASNTSSLSITEMGEATARPDKVCSFLLLPGVGHAADRGDRRRRDLGRDPSGGGELRPGDPQDSDPLRRVPGFVVNRILNSSASEVWRVTEEEGLEIEEVDRIIKESGATPMGPYYLTDLLGLDTVLHVAEHLRDSYGDRFYVSSKMKELVEAGNLGQKTGRGSMARLAWRRPRRSSSGWV